VQRATWQELDPHLTFFMPETYHAKSDDWKRVAITATQKGKSLKDMAESLAFCWQAPEEFDPKAVEKFMTEAVKPALREVAALTDYAHDEL
jgi:glutamyl-tRNA synthetase